MVRIRLRRMGKIRQASYRVVVANSESPRNGKFIEEIGSYNPRTEPPTIEIKTDRALYWLSVGAQPSDAVVRLLRDLGVMAQLEAQKGVQSQGAAETEEMPLDQVAAAEAEAEGDAEEDAA